MKRVSDLATHSSNSTAALVNEAVALRCIETSRHASDAHPLSDLSRANDEVDHFLAG